MSEYEKNPYYNPDAFGLTTVGTVELDDESYEFWTLLVQEKDGKFYVNTDSGCSCPSPFEQYTTMESLGKPLTAREAADKVTEIGRGATRAEGDFRAAFTPDYLPLVAKILNYR